MFALHLAENKISIFYSYTISMFISLVIRFASFEIIRRYRKQKIQNLPINISIIIVGILLLGILECCTAIALSWYYKDILTDIYTVIVIITVFLINILEFWVVEKYQNLFDRIHYNELMLQEANAKEKYYKEIEDSNTQIRKIRHDLKNRLIGIMSLENDLDIIKNIKLIISDLENVDRKIYTVNIVINTILNTKLQYIEKDNIKCDIYILIPRRINMDYGDAGILCGNLIDNSIEACKRLPPIERWIKIKMVYQENILLLNISNSKDKKEIIDLHKEPNRKNRGFGLKSVHGIVEKYGGTIEIIEQSDFFEVNILLYGIKGDE